MSPTSFMRALVRRRGLGAHDRRGSSYARAFERAGVGTWSIEVSTGTLRTNSAARSVIEWSGQRHPTVADLMRAVHPEDRALVEDHVRQLRLDGDDYEIEHRLLLPSGRVRHMHSVAGADRDDAGQVRALQGVTLDVTSLREARAQAEEERNLSSWILASLTEGYVLLREGVIVEVNDAMCRITGFGSAELLGSSAPRPYWPPEDVDELLAAHRQMASAGSGSGEFDALHRSGRPIRVSMTARSLRAPAGPDLWLVLVRDVTEERDREQRLRASAATDPLTGVLNSRAFRAELETAVAAHARTGEPLTLALLDIDHFKLVNDRFGHAVGDEVLHAVVARLSDATSGVGRLARVGGEEFALLMPGTDGTAARGAVSAALTALRAAPVAAAGIVTASAGVAELGDGMTDDALYRLADARLYEAKARGRDQVR